MNGLEDFDAFTDMNCHTTQYWIEAHNSFDIFLREVSGATFILNTRDKNDWIASRMEHGGGKIVKSYMEFYGVNRIEDVERYWSDEWHAHHERVYRTIPANKLLTLNLDKQVITKIDEFLGLTGPKPVNPRVGYTPTRLHDLVRETAPDFVKGLVPRSMKKRIAYTLRKRR